MNILVIGTGYVGTTMALIFCEMGHKVTGLDVDQDKLTSLQSGRLYFYEPGLEELLKKHIQSSQLRFTHDYAQAMKENSILFICVGTPMGEDGRADLSYVKNTANEIGKYMKSYKVIVDKSTVPVGTTEKVTEWIQESQVVKIPFDVVSNPEFLREGTALHDALHPNRIVVGTSSEKALKIMNQLYKDFSCPILETSPKAAELIKYAANSFLALKISYINEIARYCDTLCINVHDISKGIGLDERIGPQFLKAGIGYGGSCFPKDVNALLYSANKNNINLDVLETSVRLNEAQPFYFLDKITSILGDVKNKKMAVLGISFKPETDDIRESPAIKIIDQLLKLEATVKVHDPVAHINRDKAQQYSTVEETIDDTDAVIICTDWAQYKNLNWREMNKIMRSPYIFDGRNMLHPEEMKQLGFIYYGVGCC
ncbi:MAG: UDP-glucose/GDP-mannose dehydrogenase family protein [Bacillota bacterium]|nr:UDP-glucose/GDP-mannose dehydrogenase family protein [Bacillota bacterium]